jgi:hypothetical protein
MLRRQWLKQQPFVTMVAAAEAAPAAMAALWRSPHLPLFLRYAAVCSCMRLEGRYTLPEHFNPGFEVYCDTGVSAAT